MKTKLLILFTFVLFSVNAQTTHNIGWFTGIGPSADLTIAAGDTVIWTWLDAIHNVVNYPAGTSVEMFNSGVSYAPGTTFSHTFTAIGSNDYFCSVHGPQSMSGTITVQAVLGIEDFSLKSFLIKPNPSSLNLNIELPNNIIDAKVEVYDLLGKQIYNGKVTTAPIKISEWSKGVYLVRVFTNSATHTKRFIKQ